MQIILNEAAQAHRNELAAKLATETRLPIPRALMSAWHQLDGRTYTTTQGRAVTISDALARELDALPRTGRWIFTASPFPPTIPDKYLTGAKKWARRQNRKRIRIRWE